jgi:MFS family permease
MIPECTDKKQIYKFGFYGLLKNLKFFEPYLWIYFLTSGLTLLEIGILLSVREAIVYIFEIPSGVLADRFGKKNELVLCFVFYIFSFIMFFFADNIYMFAIGMALYGFGEAFRSGTHKAMIMEFLDYNKVKESKSRVYGLTRSYSNIGSVISSIAGVFIILFSPDISYLFLVAIVPYLLDLVLILTYPEYLNTKQDTSFVFKDFLKENILSIKYAFSTKKLNTLILESSSYHAIFKTLRDYIQPIVLAIGVYYILFNQFSFDENILIYVGLIYALAQLVSVFATRNAYRLEKYISSNKILNLAWLLTAISIIVLGLMIYNIYVVVISFVLFYLYLNIRKPFMVEKIATNTDSGKRASVLSIESQITSLIIIILAPILGYISHTYSIRIMLISFGMLMLIMYIFKPKQKSA